MQEKTAIDLSNTLSSLEEAREHLESAPDAEKVAAAEKYMAARAASSPVFAQAQHEYDLGQAGVSTPGTPPAGDTPPAGEPAEQLPSEAAPGVPLVPPPGVVIAVDNIERYGPLQEFWSKSDPTADPILATPYAFAPNTAVKTVDGEVATAQNSRIIKQVVETEALAIVSQDEFDAAFTDVNPTPPAEPEAPVPADAAEGAVPAEPDAAKPEA